jgi:CDK inhibitor PHO81
VPGWSAYYLDYKFLKKIISSLAANRPASEAAALALGIRPADIFNPTGNASIAVSPTTYDAPTSFQIDDPGQLPILSSLRQDDDRGADFQAHKAAFFFKLERELEKARESESRSFITIKLMCILARGRSIPFTSKKKQS